MDARMDSKWRTVVLGVSARRRNRFGSHQSLQWSNLVEYRVSQKGNGGIVGIVQAKLRLRPIIVDATWLLSMIQLRIIQCLRGVAKAVASPRDDPTAPGEPVDQAYYQERQDQGT
jgi:hypothetical protein